jgi:hypothetical protein
MIVMAQWRPEIEWKGAVMRLKELAGEVDGEGG